MKKLFILLCSSFALLANGQDIIREVKYSDFATPTTGEVLLQSAVTDGASFKLVIEGVNAEADMDKYKFFIDTKLKHRVNDLAGKYDVGAKTYTLDLTRPVKDLDHLAKIEIKDTADKMVYEFDVSVQANGPLKENCDISDFQKVAQDEFKTLLGKIKNVEDKDNLYIDDKNTVHLFVDHFGNYYGYAPPTTATEKYLYKIHVITSSCLAREYFYGLEYTGVYEPKFNIDKGNAQAQSSNDVQLVVFEMPAIGPFTGKFTYDVKIQEKKTGKRQTIAHAEITVPKLYHVSITTGMLATSLRNPKNIEVSQLVGRTTLTADDQSARGLLTVMAVYYPAGRSFLYPPKGGILSADRFGLVVGTQIGDDMDENFLFGITNDFARGGAITLGLHFGRKNFVPGYEDFEFGEDDYELAEVSTKKKWGLGVFVGVTVDTRVAIELLKSLAD